MIKSEKAHLIVRASSHPGMTGKKNEDRFGVSAFQTKEKHGQPVVLAVLCDGIGGHRAGEVAAEMGVDIITEHIAQSGGQKPLKTMKEALALASDAIFKMASEDQGRSGMGTTCACALVIDDRLYTTNLGDSRIYLLRDKNLIQLSTDHTWIQEALEAGIIEEEDISDHPNAHVIRRYLGAKTTPQADFRMWVFEGEDDDDALKNQGFRLEPEDTLLLCSDGLTDLVKDEEIKAILRGHDPQKAPEKLIAMANERGGHDNITVIVMKVPDNKRPFRKRPKTNFVIGCLIVFMVVSVLITTILLGIRWRNQLQAVTATETPAPTVTHIRIQKTATPTQPYFPSATPEGLPTEESFGNQDPQASLTPWPTDTQNP
jgi:PPM family protein phosphatase